MASSDAGILVAGATCGIGVQGERRETLLCEPPPQTAIVALRFTATDPASVIVRGITVRHGVVHPAVPLTALQRVFAPDAEPPEMRCFRYVLPPNLVTEGLCVVHVDLRNISTTAAVQVSTGLECSRWGLLDTFAPEPVPPAGRWRKRPVVVDAIPVTTILDTPRSEWPEWVRDGHERGNLAIDFQTAHVMVETLEGSMRGVRGDWIIRGVKGELYPCRGDVFAATYEPAGEPA